MEADKKKHVYFQISLVLVSILVWAVFIFILEFASSFITAKAADLAIDHPRLHHTWPRSSERIYKNFTYTEFKKPYTHYYNKQGWLEEYDVSISKNSYRIFYVGDSFTAGTLAMDESVPGMLERHLDEACRDKDLKIEVINTGTGGYSPVIYYILIRYYLSKYSPDLIVVNVDMTDDFDDWKYSQDVIYDPEGNPWALPPHKYSDKFIDTERGYVKADLILKTHLFLVENSYFCNLIYLVKNKFLRPGRKSILLENQKIEHERWGWCKYEWDRFTKDNVGYTMNNIRKIIDYCKANKIKLVLTGVPHYNQYSEDKETGKPVWSNRPHLEIQNIARESGVYYLDSYGYLAPFIKGTPRQKYYYRSDMHFNPKGYFIWANAHIKTITDPNNKLLPEEFYQ